MSESIQGAVSPSQRLAASSPSVAIFTDPDNLLHEDAEVVSTTTGTRTILEYWKDQETKRLPLPVDTRPTRISQAAWDEIGRAAAEFEVARLLLKPKGVAFWDVLPSAGGIGLDADAVTMLDAERDRKLKARAATIQKLTEPIEDWIARNGGRVLRRDPYLGWMLAEVDASKADALLKLKSVGRVTSGRDDSQEDNCVASCSQPWQAWPLGYGRANNRVGIDRFLNAGFDGGRSNSGFHNQSGLNIAVMERKPESSWNDEAKFFLSSSAGGSSRISKRQACFSTCQDRYNMSNTGGSSHNVSVASIALGNLENQQGYGFQMNDNCYSYPDHCADWEERASGMAPEAQLQMWADVDNSNRGRAIYEAVYEDSGSHKPDVINLSTSQWDCGAGGSCTTGCNPTSSLPDEDYIELAELNGVLVVNGPRNLTPSGSTCNLDSPGDLPTTLTVGAISANNATCANYGLGDCGLLGSSPQGGMNLTIGGLTYLGAMSGVDLVAPSEVAFYGYNATGVGLINDGGVFTGTSAAAPHVSGAAIDLKDWALSNGQTWINSPGRLHTMMLGMTDRDINGTRVLTGADNRWGLGKLRMRLFDSGGFLSPWGYSMKTRTLTSTGVVQIAAFTYPMQTGTKFVKCVLKEDEYFLSKVDASDITLQVRVTNPSNGTCPIASIGPKFVDDSFDLKHMVAISDNNTTLAGKCLTLDIRSYTISSAGRATVHAFCYASGRYDYE